MFHFRLKRKDLQYPQTDKKMEKSQFLDQTIVKNQTVLVMRLVVELPIEYILIDDSENLKSSVLV